MSDVGVFKRVSKQGKKENVLLRLPEIKDIPVTILLFLAARASILELSPFCAAMFGAVYDKKIGYLGIAVSLLGLLLRNTDQPADIIRYILSLTAFWLYSKLKEDYRKNRILSATVCGISIIAGGICTLSYHTIDFYNVILILAEGILTAFSYIIFANAHYMFSSKVSRKVITQEENICICLCAGIFMSGFSKIPLPFNISIVSILSMYAVMSLSFLLPLATAGSAAVAMGLLCVQDLNGAFSVMGMLGLCSLISNMLKTFGKFGVVIGFTAGCAVILLYNGNIPIQPIEVSIAASLVIITPKVFYQNLENMFNHTQADDNVKNIDRLRNFVRTRINNTSRIFRHLSEVMRNIEKSREPDDICDIFDDTADSVCRKCGMYVHCWKREYNSTYHQMLSLLDVLECKGEISGNEIPEDFTKRCMYPQEVCTAMSHIYELYKQNAMWEEFSDENRELIANQYDDIANIMDRLSKETDEGFNFSKEDENKIEAELDKIGIAANEVNVLYTNDGEYEVFIDTPQASNRDVCRVVSNVLGIGMRTDEQSEYMLHLCPMPRYRVKSACLREAKYGCEEYGDSICEFSRNSYSHTFILSDGMGSGSTAKNQSSLSCELLKEFISAGYSCKTGIEFLNSTLTLKSAKEIFSTIDMLDIDLKGGYAVFYKACAADSIILRDGNIETVTCSSLPIGMLNNSEITIKKIEIERGDIIIMMSDGVSGRNPVDNAAVEDILYNSISEPDIIAEKILANALRNSNNMPEDDMGLIVVKIY